MLGPVRCGHLRPQAVRLVPLIKSTTSLAPPAQALLPTGETEEHATFMSNEFPLFRPFSDISALSPVCLSLCLFLKPCLTGIVCAVAVLRLGSWCLVLGALLSRLRII